MSNATPRGLYAPRYWHTWAGMGLLWLISHLPYRLAMACGDLLGRASLPLSPWRRMIARTNLALCFPELDEQAREHLLRRNFRYTGRGVIEIGLSWWASRQRIERLGRVYGLEHLETIRAEGRGVILVGAHFACIEIAGRVLGDAAPFHAIYRENRNPVLEHLTRRARDRRFGEAIPRKDMRTLVRRLRQGEILWYPPDQDFGRQHSVFAPFFGVTAATITIPSRLATLSSAAVIPVRYHAREDGSGYEVHIEPPLQGFPSDDQNSDAARLNALFEEHIRRHPAQYYWVHRRFKTRPEGEPRYYPKRRRSKQR